MSFNLNYLKKPELKKPIAIAGLPGIAFVGKLGIEFLIRELKAEKFAELYADYFPGWVLREDGLVRGLRMDFYEASPDGSDHDFILITADAQASSSQGQYKLTHKMLDVIADQNAEAAITLAAFLSAERENTPVVGAATDSDKGKMIADHGVELLDKGRIVGMNGLFPGLALDRGMWGFCLLGTTKGGDLDPNASKEVLRVLSDIFNFGLDLSHFEDRIPDLPKFKPPKMKMPTVPGTEKDIKYIR
ncbi:hypothetical protein AKJ43_00255 [candidate division MSBL1 archaeon SCGC-AAA261D19]|uniref:Proteasome assembly chaperone family protein n=1 Tax=candidate division MSBL1 archaeon SCGC-AAA261D19 TaxID=1698273 RepID=A0A133V8T8_9EURY|nr:hypothetical protein AKJ43_00255 [candidate division MSBL1 archaeon SCGC-AAA261D19]